MCAGLHLTFYIWLRYSSLIQFHITIFPHLTYTLKDSFHTLKDDNEEEGDNKYYEITCFEFDGHTSSIQSEFR